MGLGRDQLQEAMIDHMVEQELAEDQVRKEGFARLRYAAQEAKTVDELKALIIVLLNLIEQRM